MHMMETKSLSYKINGGIVYVTVIGEVGFEEQRDFVQELLSDPALPNPVKILRDTRKQVGLIGSRKNLQQMISFTKTSVLARMAIVATEDLIFGMSRVFRAHVEDETVSVFRDLDEAREWLLRDELAA